MVDKKENGLFTKYFVLNPHSKDPIHKHASILSILMYAYLIEYNHKSLAEDLRNWMMSIGHNSNIYKELKEIIVLIWHLYSTNNPFPDPKIISVHDLFSWLREMSNK